MVPLIPADLQSFLLLQSDTHSSCVKISTNFWNSKQKSKEKTNVELMSSNSLGRDYQFNLVFQLQFYWRMFGSNNLILSNIATWNVAFLNCKKCHLKEFFMKCCWFTYKIEREEKVKEESIHLFLSTVCLWLYLKYFHKIKRNLKSKHETKLKFHSRILFEK